MLNDTIRHFMTSCTLAIDASKSPQGLLAIAMSRTSLSLPFPRAVVDDVDKYNLIRILDALKPSDVS